MSLGVSPCILDYQSFVTQATQCNGAATQGASKGLRRGLQGLPKEQPLLKRQPLLKEQPHGITDSVTPFRENRLRSLFRYRRKTAMPPKAKAPPPMPRYEPSQVDQLKSKIHDLQNDLFVARQALLHLMDPQDLMRGYFRIDDFEKLDEWRRDRAEAVIKEAWVRPGDEMGDPRWPRAICPLCRQGAQGTRDIKGYAVPEGLRRHLLGELNSQQCAVFGAAESIARDSIHEAREAAREGRGLPQVR